MRMEGREEKEFNPAFQALEDAMDLDDQATETISRPAQPQPNVDRARVSLPKGYYDLDDAPRDGKHIWIRGADQSEEVEGFWRHTRRWDKNGGKWREVGFWAESNTGGRAVAFQPMCWAPLYGVDR